MELPVSSTAGEMGVAVELRSIGQAPVVGVHAVSCEGGRHKWEDIEDDVVITTPSTVCLCQRGTGRDNFERGIWSTNWFMK